MPIVTEQPYAGWARVAALFHRTPPVRPGAHPAALVAEDARLDPSAEIGPYAAIGRGVAIRPQCRVGAHASLSHTLRRRYPEAGVGSPARGAEPDPAVRPQHPRSSPGHPW